MLINTPISVGELIDKITILQIKRERIDDLEKLNYVNNELTQLLHIIIQNDLNTAELKTLSTQLKTINETLWGIEDAIRDCERAKDFSDIFIQLARRVYITNDKRAEIKREINKLTNSVLHEVKSYQDYA